MEFKDIVLTYKKYVEPFVAIAVLIMICVACFLIYNDFKAKSEIGEKCGWADEDVRCWCKKGEVVERENIYHDEFEGLLNVTLDK